MEKHRRKVWRRKGRDVAVRRSYGRRRFAPPRCGYRGRSALYVAATTAPPHRGEEAVRERRAQRPRGGAQAWCIFLRGVSTFLGRPWKSHIMVIFMRCSLQDIIDPAGWESWKAGVSVPDTICYGEFQNRGDGAKTQDRVKWPGFHDITDPAVAENFTVLHIYEISGTSCQCRGRGRRGTAGWNRAIQQMICALL